MEDPGIRRGCRPGDKQRRIHAPRVAGWRLPLLRADRVHAEPLVARADLRRRSRQGAGGSCSGNFVVLERGIYYIDRPSGEGGIYCIDRPSGETRLQYFDFATRRSTTVARNLGNVDIPLTASPDGRTILYSRMDSSVDDLMLVENFR